MVGVGPLYFVG